MSKKTPIDRKAGQENGDEFIFNDDVADVEDEKWWWVFQNPFGIIMVVALCVILSVGLWFIFQGSSSDSSSVAEVRDNEGVLVVKANPEPYKVAPSTEDAAGSVDNQDKEVFKRLKFEESKNIANAEEESTTVLNQEIEQPVEVHNLPDADEVKPQGEKVPPKSDEARKDLLNVTIAKAEPVIKKEESPQKLPEKAVSKQVPKQLCKGLYMIRVASFRKPETAERELVRVIGLLPKEYRFVGREVRRIDSDTGAFYLALMGAFNSLAEAKTVAAILKEKSCSVVIQKVK